MSIFKIETLDGKITNVEEMTEENDAGFARPLVLKSVVERLGWNYFENPYHFGKFETTAGRLAGRSKSYIVGVDKWSVACRLVEKLLEAGK